MNHPVRPQAQPSIHGRGRLLAVIAIATALLMACAAPGASQSPTSPDGLDLEGTSWRAALVRGVAPLVGAEPTITFDGGQAAGTTGCNTYGGAYHVDADGRFAIEAMIMTEMACDGARGAQETVVTEILGAADRIDVADGHLEISGPAGSITFVQVQG
jgi:heat shock protein HslJ